MFQGTNEEPVLRLQQGVTPLLGHGHMQWVKEPSIANTIVMFHHRYKIWDVDKIIIEKSKKEVGV